MLFRSLSLVLEKLEDSQSERRFSSRRSCLKTFFLAPFPFASLRSPPPLNGEAKPVPKRQGRASEHLRSNAPDLCYTGSSECATKRGARHHSTLVESSRAMRYNENTAIVPTIRLYVTGDFLSPFGVQKIQFIQKGFSEC